MTTTAPGYTFDATLDRSPVTMDQLAELEASVLWSDDDREALRRAGEILVPQTEQILDVWYGFVGGNAHLVAAFAGADGQPSGEYLGAVRERFGLWIRDVCERDHDQQWLDYQNEVALRHHTSKKNATDEVDSPAGYVPLAHLIALIVPITVTIRPFLANGEPDAAAVDAMYQAWFKAVTLTVALWAHPYAPDTW
ncbi:protoglobin domain-containing protein [Agromyces sp. NPDC058484]|uniref:protoglobin domain-containing protein n=1 Tax=Agromyces sp. NPDC058484 TaxID=3346524 RepID=UPI0036600B25